MHARQWFRCQNKAQSLLFSSPLVVWRSAPRLRAHVPRKRGGVGQNGKMADFGDPPRAGRAFDGRVSYRARKVSAGATSLQKCTVLNPNLETWLAFKEPSKFARLGGPWGSGLPHFHQLFFSPPGESPGAPNGTGFKSIRPILAILLKKNLFFHQDFSPHLNNMGKRCSFLCKKGDRN